MKPQIVLHACSPDYTADVAADLVARGERAFHPAHAIADQARSDQLADEWIDYAEKILVYADEGLSPRIEGMLRCAEYLQVDIETRSAPRQPRPGLLARLREAVR